MAADANDPRHLVAVVRPRPPQGCPPRPLPASTMSFNIPNLGASSMIFGGTWGTVGVTPLPVSMGGIPATKQVVGVAVMRKES